MNYLSLIFMTWTIRIFCNVTLSITIKSLSGLSYSRISIGLPIFLIYFEVKPTLSDTLVPSLKTYPGNLTLQSSHSNAFQQYVLTHSPSFMLRFEFSHSLKHSKWMWLMVPAHLQGEIKGSVPSFSSPRHILQTLPSMASLAFASIWSCNFNFCFWFFLYFFLLRLSLLFSCWIAIASLVIVLAP